MYAASGVGAMDRSGSAFWFGDAQGNLAGLGDANQNISIGTQAASIATGAATSAGWISAAAAGPIGAAIAGVGLALTAIFNRVGPAQKVATTQIVNEVEPQLQANLDAYLSGPRTVSDQRAALANFDYAWSEVVRLCGQAQYGNPGQACINDRKQGACEWRDAEDRCWNWFSGFRDPIANDTPNPDPTATGEIASAFDGISGGGGGMLVPLAIAALVALAVAS